MNQEKLSTSILEMVSNLKSGEKIVIQYDGNQLKELTEQLPNIDVQLNSPSEGMHTIKRAKNNQPSASKQIMQALNGYKTGFISLPYPDAYVRQIVSKFNKVNNANFKVKCTKGEMPSIYKELEDREFITQAEFEAFELSMLAKLDLMRSCIVEVDEVEIVEDEATDVDSNEMI